MFFNNDLGQNLNRQMGLAWAFDYVQNGPKSERGPGWYKTGLSSPLVLRYCSYVHASVCSLPEDSKIQVNPDFVDN